MSQLTRLAQALRAPFLAFGRHYNATAAKYPLATGVVTTVIKTSAADYFAQTVVERRDHVDWRRHGMFCMFGFAYLGCFQYYLYNHLFVRWCSSITRVAGHIGAAPLKTFIDQALHLKGLVEGRPWPETWRKYREDLWENCKALWMIWVPAQLVNFTVVPLHLRIPFVAGVSFAWTVVISCMRGALETPPTTALGSASHLPPATATTGAASAVASVAATATQAVAAAAVAASAPLVAAADSGSPSLQQSGLPSMAAEA